MRRRVSTGLTPSWNVLTSTAPLGKSNSPSAPTVIFAPSGRASQRPFSAPSRQRGELTPNGTSPAAGFLASEGSTQPVFERRSGKFDGGAPALGTIFQMGALLARP